MNLRSTMTFFASILARTRRADRWVKALVLAVGTSSVTVAIHPTMIYAQVDEPLHATIAERAPSSMTSSASTADTAISCRHPEVQISTGRTGSGDKPRVTVLCTGGTNVMPIQYFAFELSANETLSLLIERVVAGWTAANHGPMYILTNLSDTSGAAWGCGAANCRILDFIDGE